ncbi:hypothetical protein SeLEV6574_g03503 [Synchytrium endobioticum]|nr:hypothetical protein SeLEV6574_g03503 [Synchytrium endobioticum]
MLQLYGIETTMQPGTSCTASCMNALVRSSAAPTQSRINHDSQYFKMPYIALRLFGGGGEFSMRDRSLATDFVLEPRTCLSRHTFVH